jgi:sigma-B regulation protein RsbU (phosphoserine phosphatase)
MKVCKARNATRAGQAWTRIALFVLTFPLLTSAQVFDATSLGEPVRIPSGEAAWRFRDEGPGRSGSASGWASPAFDDSSWSPGPGDAHAAGKPIVRWFRLRIRLPRDSDRLGLYCNGLAGAFEVFADGIPIGGLGSLKIGSLTPEPSVRLRRAVVLTLPPAHRQTILLALRVWMDTPYLVPVHQSLPGLENATLLMGDRQVLLGTRHLENAFQDSLVIVQTLKAILAFGITAILLVSYAGRTDLKANLWLGLSLIGHGIYYALSASVAADTLSLNFFIPLSRPISYLLLIAEIQFLFEFLGRPVHPLVRALQVAFAAAASAGLFLPLLAGNWWYVATQPLALLSTGSLWLGLLIVLSARGNREARFLLVPAFLRFFSRIGLLLLTTPGARRVPTGAMAFHAGVLQFDYDDLATYGYFLSVGLVLLHRFFATTGEYERTFGELAAAREAQSRLVPIAPPGPPGYTIEAAYFAASEVGGDFYQTSPLPGGSCLILIGDVSGKGLKAAITGTLLIGAWRSLVTEETSPGQILSRLNQMLPRGSASAPGAPAFATCQCILIGPGGACTIANAGHLAPYHNGIRIETPGNLPLGLAADLAPDAAFGEYTFQLNPGDRLTLLSDGVVEARNNRDGLFGFDRTQKISTQEASRIAETARLFGQEDDITVLTLTRCFAGAITR